MDYEISFSCTGRRKKNLGQFLDMGVNLELMDTPYLITILLVCIQIDV